MKYRKKPVVVDAVQWWKHGDHPAVSPTGNERTRDCGRCLSSLPHGLINTLEGLLLVCPGDWIVTGVKGERYPCKPDIFEETYEPEAASDASRSFRIEDLYEFKELAAERECTCSTSPHPPCGGCEPTEREVEDMRAEAVLLLRDRLSTALDALRFVARGNAPSHDVHLKAITALRRLGEGPTHD